MISGITFTAGYIIYFYYVLPKGSNNADNWLLGISPEGIGSIGMLINFAVTIGVSHLTKAPPDDVQELVERIREPSE